MPRRDFTRRADEPVADYIARLEAIPASELTPQQESARRFYLQAAEEEQQILAEKSGRGGRSAAAVDKPRDERKPPPEPAPLERCQQAYRNLSAEERQQFILWLVRGDPG
jgi:hypothetical protein